MPNITPYDAGNLGLRPSEIGVESMAAAGRRLGVYGSQIADVKAREGAELGSAVRDAGTVANDYLTHRAISAKSVEAANMFLSLDQQWNDTIKNADPNDPSVAQKFREEVLKPTLDRFNSGDALTTADSQAYTDGIVNKYRQHFFQKTAADMSTMAGIAAKQNATETINKMSSAVYLDPSSLGTAIDVLKHSSEHIVGSSPTIDAETGARVTAEVNQKGIESLVKSAVMGMIEKNPNTDLDAIQKKYGEYINGAELKQFQKTAQTQARVDLLQQKQLETYNRQQAKKEQATELSKNFTDNVTFDQNGHPTIKPQFFKGALDIEKRYPGVATADVRTMLSWGKSKQNEEVKAVTDPAVASALDDRMFNPESPTTKMEILRAEADYKLTSNDARVRMAIVDQRDKMPTDPQFKFAIDGAKQLIEGRTAGEKDLQAGKYAAFMQEFLTTYQQQKVAGTLPPNALNLRDPKSLISQMIESYKSPLAAAISGNGGVATPAATPAVPASLRGIAALSYSPTRKVYRDDTTGQLYNADGSKAQ